MKYIILNIFLELKGILPYEQYKFLFMISNRIHYI